MCALVEGLPPEAAIQRVGGEQWTSRDELLAAIAERVDAWGLLHARLQMTKKQQKYLPKRSLEIPRPGEKQENTRDRVVTDPREIAAWFGTS